MGFNISNSIICKKCDNTYAIKHECCTKCGSDNEAYFLFKSHQSMRNKSSGFFILAFVFMFIAGYICNHMEIGKIYSIPIVYSVLAIFMIISAFFGYKSYLYKRKITKEVSIPLSVSLMNKIIFIFSTLAIAYMIIAVANLGLHPTNPKISTLIYSVAIQMAVLSVVFLLLRAIRAAIDQASSR